MRNKTFDRYSTTKINLRDALDFLTEKQDAVNRQILRYPSKEDAETLPQLVGKIQGLELAITYLEHHFGGTQ